MSNSISDFGLSRFRDIYRSGTKQSNRHYVTEMMSEFLIDTNVVIALFDNDVDVLHKFNQAREIYLSVIVVGELVYGAKKSIRVTQNLQKITDLLTECELLEIDLGTTEHYANIKLQLKQKGNPIPDNDTWIAASALSNGLILATRDNHFNVIDNLPTEYW